VGAAPAMAETQRAKMETQWWASNPMGADQKQSVGERKGSKCRLIVQSVVLFSLMFFKMEKLLESRGW